MPTNNFKLFDENKANLLSDTEYANATQRLNGVQTGVASSQLNNKFSYQVSLVAYAIAQIMNQNGLDASDTLAVSAFVGNLGGSLLQKVADKASTAEAAAGVLTNKYISPATMKAAALLLSGGTMSGSINMGNNKITNLADPTDSLDSANKKYVDRSSFPQCYKKHFIKEFNFTNNSNTIRFTIKNANNIFSNFNGFYFEFIIDQDNNLGSIMFTLKTEGKGTLEIIRSKNQSYLAPYPKTSFSVLMNCGQFLTEYSNESLYLLPYRVRGSNNWYIPTQTGQELNLSSEIIAYFSGLVNSNANIKFYSF